MPRVTETKTKTAARAGRSLPFYWSPPVALLGFSARLERSPPLAAVRQGTRVSASLDARSAPGPSAGPPDSPLEAPLRRLGRAARVAPPLPETVADRRALGDNLGRPGRRGIGLPAGARGARGPGRSAECRVLTMSRFPARGDEPTRWAVAPAALARPSPMPQGRSAHAGVCAWSRAQPSVARSWFPGTLPTPACRAWLAAVRSHDGQGTQRFAPGAARAGARPSVPTNP